jgi:hypothetical protein
MAKSKINASQRNEIYRAWARGLTPETLAATYGVSVIEIRKIIDREVAKQPLASERHPEALIREYQLRVTSVIEEFAAVGGGEKGLARVAAIRGRFQALKHLFEVNQQLGYVPSDPVIASGLSQFRRDFERLLDLVKFDELPEETQDAIGREFDPNWDEPTEYIPPLEEDDE